MHGSKRLPRSVRLLIVARAVNRLGAFSMSFLTVLITTSFGASAAVAGYVSAAFGLATIPSRLAGGRLADRIGRRRTIVMGLTGCAVAQLGLAAADSLSLVICCAVLLGLVFELYEPPSQAMIADVVAPGEHVRAYGLLNAALAAAGMGAGLLAAGLGRWDLRWLFVVDAITCLLCALTVQLVLPADHRTATAAVPEQGLAVAPWRDRALLLLLATGTFFAVIYLQIMITLPLAMDHAGLQPADAGLLFTASALTICAGQPLMSWSRLSTLSAPVAFTAGHLLLALGLGGYALAHTLVGYLAATVVWSVGDLLLVGRVYAVVAELAPTDGKGRYLAVYGTSWGIAGITAPVMGTQLIEYAGPAGLWSAMALACLLLAVLQPAVVRLATPCTVGDGQRRSVSAELPDQQPG
ncbi:MULTISPECIES: MFS transporter [unclassified Streptomyces]|uniref:MFS transporter n=1 Tax=Streptomyces sp. NBC_00119 TaxID=2975659 RepID=A0AAU1UM62_9ACTN|nr:MULTISPECIES: MFS transporter [unclassified Streptomyces]MCX4649261.1 MFS transporter [Streptomyces sp. NBC_01446]MCX5321528.1 MFS transporter [Streptomyces sp. NBC_00120]